MRIRIWAKAASRIAACLTVLTAGIAVAQDNAEPGIMRLSDQGPPAGAYGDVRTVHGESPEAHGDVSFGTQVLGRPGFKYEQAWKGGRYVRDTHPTPEHRSRTAFQVWLRGDGSKTVPPDYGWQPPIKYPYHRTPVTYQRYLPNQYYGSPSARWVAAYPMVYTPTDTTQLGYYYQHVPTWEPRALVPAPPIPHQWHHYAPMGLRADQLDEFYRNGGQLTQQYNYSQPGAPLPAGYSPIQPVPQKSEPPVKTPEAPNSLPEPPAPDVEA